MAYHAGALKALDEHGVDVVGSDLLVGTSAGAIKASYLAAGWTPQDFFDYAGGLHPRSPHDEDGQRAEVAGMFTPLWADRRQRVQRMIGSSFALASSRGILQKATRGRAPNARFRRAFPSGMYSTAETRARLYDDLPEEWPREGLYICATDLYGGKRVPFGRDGEPKVPLPEAVLASTSIPGVFPPVRLEGKQYVDGGASSATSLDLAARDGCNSIICIAPLGYRNEGNLVIRDPKAWAPMLTRSFFARPLAKEVRAAREKGIAVFVIRPWVEELKALGTNAMRHFDRKTLVEATRVSVLKLLEDHGDHPALQAAATPRARAKKRA